MHDVGPARAGARLDSLFAPNHGYPLKTALALAIFDSEPVSGPASHL